MKYILIATYLLFTINLNAGACNGTGYMSSGCAQAAHDTGYLKGTSVIDEVGKYATKEEISSACHFKWLQERSFGESWESDFMKGCLTRAGHGSAR